MRFLDKITGSKWCLFLQSKGVVTRHGHRPQPDPEDSYHHSLIQPITRMEVTVQHIIQYLATSTVIWL
jgi:hypothetical protein